MQVLQKQNFQHAFYIQLNVDTNRFCYVLTQLLFTTPDQPVFLTSPALLFHTLSILLCPHLQCNDQRAFSTSYTYYSAVSTWSKAGLSPPPPVVDYWPFQGDASVVV